MNNASGTPESRVAVLVDCDNVSPDILEHALRVVAQFGRVVMRRGYGNASTLGSRWQAALVKLAFTPCLQYQYVAGKNTTDIALVLDAQEALFDGRADTFCLVTSDSDFSYLCRKLRERGATVYIVGEPKSPEALRNSSDQFFEWQRDAPLLDAAQPETVVEAALGLPLKQTTKPAPTANPALTAKPAPTAMLKATPSAKPKRQPQFVVDAVKLLAAETPDGKVSVSSLGQYLKRTDPSFSPQTFGHAGLLNLLKKYPSLKPEEAVGGHWTVTLSSKG